MKTKEVKGKMCPSCGSRKLVTWPSKKCGDCGIPLAFDETLLWGDAYGEELKKIREELGEDEHS